MNSKALTAKKVDDSFIFGKNVPNQGIDALYIASNGTHPVQNSIALNREVGPVKADLFAFDHSEHLVTG